MTVPTRTLKCFRQSLHRYGMGFREAMTEYRVESQRGQVISLGQRCCSNHRSAASLSGNISKSSTTEIPCHSARPGPFFAMIHAPFCLSMLASIANIKWEWCQGFISVKMY